METLWKKYGKDVERMWKGCGNNMEMKWKWNFLSVTHKGIILNIEQSHQTPHCSVCMPGVALSVVVIPNPGPPDHTILAPGDRVHLAHRPVTGQLVLSFLKPHNVFRL